MHAKFYLLLWPSCYNNSLKHKNDLSISSKIYNFLKIKQIHLTLQVLKKILSIPNFPFQHKAQNWKLGNLRNFQLPSTKQLQALKKFLSFLSFWFQHKGQTWKTQKFPISSNKRNSFKFRSLEKISKFSEFLISV